MSLVAAHGEVLAGVARDLELTAAQQLPWQTYAEAVGALMADQMRGQRPVARADNAVEQIGRKVDVVRNRLAAMEDIQRAADQLYQVLTPEQQAIADVRLAATVPALYSGLSATPRSADRTGERRGPPPGGPGGGF